MKQGFFIGISLTIKTNNTPLQGFQRVLKKNANDHIDFINALNSLKKARLVTRAFMINDQQFKGLTQEEQNKLKNSITPFFNTIFEIEDKVLAWYREFHEELTDDDDLIESIEDEYGYETLISEKGKIDLAELFKEAPAISASS